jgi:hypothetical protein
MKPSARYVRRLRNKSGGGPRAVVLEHLRKTDLTTADTEQTQRDTEALKDVHASLCTSV